MKVHAIDCTIPSQKIVNDEILDIIKYYSKSGYTGNYAELEAYIYKLFKKTGIESRFWRSKNQKPIDLIAESIHNCLKMCSMTMQDIDILIYVGVDRGFAEPANACFIAKKIGVRNLRTFDIVDACMGWCTAVQISHAIMNNREAEKILIVSSECPMDQDGSLITNNFKIDNRRQLNWKFPTFTIGEAVTSTVLVTSPHKWRFVNTADNSKADLCTIPLMGFYKYTDYSENLLGKHIFEFSAYGRELFLGGYEKAYSVLESYLDACSIKPRTILPHSVSMQVIKRIEDRVKPNINFYSTFPKIGNVATSSIPANLYFAKLKGLVSKDTNLTGWIASSGLKFSAFDIIC